MKDQVNNSKSVNIEDEDTTAESFLSAISIYKNTDDSERAKGILEEAFGRCLMRFMIDMRKKEN